jgi:hypothetical protein
MQLIVVEQRPQHGRVSRGTVSRGAGLDRTVGRAGSLVECRGSGPDT